MTWWSTAVVVSSLVALGCGSSHSEPRPGPEGEAGQGGRGGSAGRGSGGTHAGTGGSARAGEDAGGEAGSAGNDAEPGAGHGGSAGGSHTAAGEGGDGGAEPAPPKAPPGETLFADERVLEVRLTLSESDWDDLEEHGDREEYVVAAAAVSGNGFDSVSFDQVGLRHKGAWSLHHCWDEFDGVRSHADECAKLSYKLKFDEYDEDGRLDGLKRLNLHASSGDATKLREFLAYATFREFGVEAPRTVPVRVFINDELQGLFIGVEDIDGRFTKAHFPDGPDGNLYKEVWPRSEAGDADFVAALETNEEAGDVADLREFATAIAGSSTADFEDRMEPWVDLDDVLRYIAVDRALKNWDGITAFYSPLTPHNFFWYHDDGGEDRFHLIPWDLDNTFWEFDPYMHPAQWVTAPPVPDWNSTPLDCAPRSVWEEGGMTLVTPPRCDPFLDLLARTRWNRFVTIANELLAGPLKLSKLAETATFRADQIESLVAEDPTLDLAVWQDAVTGFSAILEQGITDFEAFVAEGLIEEPPPAPPELTPEELNVVTEDTGVHVDGMTNFEFATPPVGVPTGVEAYADPLSTYLATWNTSAPSSGTADLLLDFTFQRGPGAYDEWVNLAIGTASAVDISALTRIMITLRTDIPRTVRVRLASAAYETSFGGVWSEFGQDFGASSTPRTVQINLHELTYPSWARDAWAEGQGWTTTDEEALGAVLQSFGGLIFAPGATLDAAGELTAESEVGALWIDNIYFR